MMKFSVSVWSDYYPEFEVEDAITQLQAAGFSYTELSINHGKKLLERSGTPEQVGRALAIFAKNRDFSIPQGHLSFKAGLCDSAVLDGLKRELDLFLGIGIENAVIHANGGSNLTEEERFQRRVENLSALAEYLNGTSLKLCLENLGSVPETHTVERIRKIMSAVGSDQLGICLDTGHLHLVNGKDLAQQSQREFICGAGKDLRAMHITNNSGGGDDHLMPFSSRFGIDYKEVMSALREIGYKGLFNLEILGENKAPMYIRNAKLDYIKKMTDYMTSDEFLTDQ